MTVGCGEDDGEERIPDSADVEAHVCKELLTLSDILYDANATPEEQGETGPRLIAVGVLAREAAQRNNDYELLAAEVTAVEDALARRDGDGMRDHLAAAEAQCYIVGEL